MPNNKRNRWGIELPAIKFVENFLTTHNKVEAFERTRDIQFNITRKQGFAEVKAVITNVYVFGEASFHAVLHEFPGTNAIVNTGQWNTIILDWRAVAQDTDVLIVGISHFFGALNVNRIISYIPPDERPNGGHGYRRSS